MIVLLWFIANFSPRILSGCLPPATIKPGKRFYYILRVCLSLLSRSSDLALPPAAALAPARAFVHAPAGLL